MFKFYIEKSYIRRTCSSETKQNVYNLVYLVSKLCEFWFTTVGFEPMTSRSTSGDFNNLQRHFPRLQEIWNFTKKKNFPETSKTRRNFGNPNVKHNILHFTTRVFGHQPKNGVIALWPNTCVVKCKYCVSQKRNEASMFYSLLICV